MKCRYAKNQRLTTYNLLLIEKLAKKEYFKIEKKDDFNDALYKILKGTFSLSCDNDIIFR